MKQITISAKKLFIVAGLLFLLIGGYWLWTYFTSPTGSQKVNFVAAKSEKFTSGNLNFTVYRAENGVSEDVIYHLHGRNMDDSIWNDDTYFTSLVQSYWQKSSTKPPTVVVVSYGSVWLLTPKNSTEASGLMDDFVVRLPEIESKIGKPRNRILLGESMGGLNVLILGLSHPNLFSKVASLCPGVYVDSPFSDFSTMRAAAKRTGADPKIAFGILQMAKTYVSNEEEWNAISPLKLIERADDKYPELYLSCGLYDKYGNFEGAEALANIAIKKGVKTKWHPLYGGHCAMDIASLADFLAAKQ
ncbi:MAG TPA: alpha/beta hydrolase-fold protein [Pyrinomonadaceae bacterium]|nr:alpha/beta hydrolase-fold protein [Pyrinomonadaceae bacterium]